MAIKKIFMSTQQNKIPPLPYPLSRKTRLTIMLSLFGIFLVATPIVILYARGYTYDFKTHSIFHGGALSIETEPAEARVFINDILMKQTSPLKISHVLPGNYHIRIEGKNAIPWEKDINIVSNETTYLHDIDLFSPTPGQIILEHSTPIHQMYQSKNANFFLFSTHENDVYEFSLFDFASQKESFVTRIISTSTPIIEQTNSGDMLRIEYEQNGVKNVLLMNPHNPMVSQSDGNLGKHQWLETSNSNFYLTQNKNTLDKLNITSVETLFTLSTSTLEWFVDGKNTLWEYSTNSIRHYENGQETLNASVANPISRFIDVNENRIIAQSRTNMVIFKIEKDQTLTENIFPLTQLVFDTEQNYILSFHDGELSAIHPDGSTNLINRFSENIKNVIPLTPEGTLLLVMEKKLVAFHPKYFIPQEIFTADSIESVNVDTKKRVMYVLETVGGVRGISKIGY